VVCTFSSNRLARVIACVESVLAQRPAPAQVVVVVDHNEDLRDELRSRLSDEVEVVVNDGEPGLSSARNTAVARSTGETIVFLDDDAVAHERWLASLLAGFEDPEVIGVGGHALPAWQGEAPRWLPDEFLWVVGCSYRGLPASGAVRNPLGCNMAFRAGVFARAGPFDPRVGRLGSRPFGCEETEFCTRAVRAIPGSRLVMVAGAEVDHHVPLERARPGYVLRRCYHEGVSKAIVRRLAGPATLNTERSYLGRVMPVRLWKCASRALTGPMRIDALGAIGVIVGGLLAAAAGYAGETLCITMRRASGRSEVAALGHAAGRSNLGSEPLSHPQVRQARAGPTDGAADIGGRLGKP
jgi:hypothetical protein